MKAEAIREKTMNCTSKLNKKLSKTLSPWLWLTTSDKLSSKIKTWQIKNYVETNVWLALTSKDGDVEW